MTGRVRLGAVGYLNARPLVFGLDKNPRFDVRYDIPSECARLLHAHEIDVGLVEGPVEDASACELPSFDIPVTSVVAVPTMITCRHVIVAIKANSVC